MSANNLSYRECRLDAVNSRTSKQITRFFDELLTSSCVKWGKTLFVSMNFGIESLFIVRNGGANT